MPFLAVVWLKDEEEASEFITTMADDADVAVVGRLAGLYRFPKRDVKLCRTSSGGCRHTTWTRHRLGHMVHGCGLRNPRWWKMLSGVFLDLLGVNLLPRDETPGLFRNPEGWDAPENASSFGPTLPTKKGPRQE